MLLSACSSSGWIELSVPNAKSKYTDADVCSPEVSFAERYRATPGIDSEIRSNPSPFTVPPRRKPAFFASERPGHPIVVGLRRLIGLDRTSTKALLGNPSLYQEDPPARIWSYNAGICGLKIFFYPRVDIEEFSVLTYEISGSTVSTNEEQTRVQSPHDKTSTRIAEAEKSRRCLAILVASRDSPAAR